MIKFDNLVNSFEANKQEIFKNIFELLGYPGVRIYLVSAVITNIFTWLFARYIYVNIGQERMALHYSVDFGVDFYGERSGIFIIPALGFIFIIFNIFLLLAILFYNKRDTRFLSHLMLSTAVIANVALLVAIFTVYLINFR
jgi:hypothetical protein